jgi:hypothetical protein
MENIEIELLNIALSYVHEKVLLLENKYNDRLPGSPKLMDILSYLNQKYDDNEIKILIKIMEIYDYLSWKNWDLLR